jgi:DNA polymerase-1
LPTNAVYGFTTMVLKLLNEVKPEYLVIVFDAPGKTFRAEMLASYKANRPSTPPDLSAQVELVHQVVAAFRLPVLAVPGVEADDVIATIIERCGADKTEYVVITADKDLMQLVRPNVKLWDTMRDKWVDEAAVMARFGVTPAQVVDVLALVGDPIDNIPGVKGIGEKTAVALLREFGDIEGILAHVDAIGGMKLRGAKVIAERLREGAETARLSRRLATVLRDVDVECTLDAFRLPGADMTVLRPLFDRLGFQSLIPRLLDQSAPLAVDARVVDTPAEIDRHLAAMRPDLPLALVSVAEPGLSPTNGARAIVVYQQDGQPAVLSLAEPAARAAVTAALARRPTPLITHDLKRDLLQLHACGVPLDADVFDVMIASYLLEATGTHQMAELAREVLGTRVDEFRSTVSGTAAGVSLLPSLFDRFALRLKETGLERLFYEIEMPLARVLAAMEQRGVRIDAEGLRALSDEFTRRMDTLMREIYALAGEEFNINSAPQLRVVLFDRLRLPKQGVRRGKTGFSTDVDVLNRLARVHPLPAKILEYRALAKLKSTYVDALPAAVNPLTGRLHTTFNQTVAATGRLSSSDPNLQNIPIRGEEGRRIRQMFIAAPGHVLLAADYSQIELRVLAHLSGDPAFLDAFRNDQDIHARTAAEVFGVMPGLVTSDMRRAAKVINFGIIYGMGPQRLAHELGITLTDAQRYIEQYFTRHAGVRSYMHSIIEQARVTGHVSTISGRRRSVPELRSTERGVAQAAERVATNTPIQGAAADLIKMAMVRVERRLHQDQIAAALVLQVHDELLLEVREDATAAATAAVREEMEGVMTLAVPLRVDVGVGRTWAEAH